MVAFMETRMIEASAAYQPPANPASDTLLGSYLLAGSGYDEMCSAPGTPRPHWRDLLQSLEELGGRELERRHAEVQRLLQADGVTYNTYDDPRGSHRHWLVDPIPLLMTGEEWETLAAGLAQRSRLLNALLADLYSQRLTIRQGWLPPELIYAYPGFLPPCHQSLPAGCRWLIFHGVDLARGPDGVIRAQGDRAQSPSGAGYTTTPRRTRTTRWWSADSGGCAPSAGAPGSWARRSARTRDVDPCPTKLTPPPCGACLFFGTR